MLNHHFSLTQAHFYPALCKTFRGPKATDVKMSKRASRAHARCLRRHNAVLTDRLERMSKPPRRNIICLWRENADTLPADTVSCNVPSVREPMQGSLRHRPGSRNQKNIRYLLGGRMPMSCQVILCFTIKPVKHSSVQLGHSHLFTY